MIIKRVHRNMFPKTDHGFTWVECMWFERDGRRISPLIPVAGCCERLGTMPGGPIRCDLLAEEKRYASEGVHHTEKSESVHDDTFYRVGTVSIVPDTTR